MADQIETSKLGLDASQVLSTLVKLAKQYGIFTEAILENTDAIDKFNISQDALEEAVKAGANILGSAISKLEAYAEAEKKVANAANLAAEAERNAAKARRKSAGDSVANDFKGQGGGPNSLATPQEVSKFDKAIQSLRALISQSDITEDRIREINNRLADNYEGTEREIRDALLRVQQATERLGASAAKGLDKAISEVAAAKRKLEGTDFGRTLGDSLGFDRSSALDKTIQTFDRLADKIGELASKSGTSVDRIKQINNDLSASYTGAEREIRDTLQRLASEVEKSNNRISDSTAAASAAAARSFAANLKASAGSRNGSATGKESGAFDKAAADLEKLAAKYGVTAQRIEEINKDLTASYTGAERDIRDSLVRLGAAFDKLGASAQKDLDKAATDAAKRTKTSIDDAKKSLDFFNGGLVRTGDLARGLVLYRAFNLAEDAITSAIGRARELDTVLAQIQTIADSGILPGDLGRQQLQDFTAGVAADFGIDQVEVARATYEAFSNQLGSTSETLQFVRDAATLAKGGVGDLDGAVDLLSSSIHGLGTTTNETSRLIDVMFKTVDLGVTSIDELSHALGPVFPLAGQLGIRAEEVGAAFAVLTQQGFTTDEAITRLSRGMTALIKPSGAMEEAMRKLGVTTASAGIQASGGFIPFIQRLVATTDGSTESLSKLFDEIREGQFAFIELRDGASQYNKFLGEFDDKLKTVGVGAKALNTVLESQSQQLQKNAEAFKTALAGEIGDRVIVFLNAFIDRLGGAKNAAEIFADAVELAFKVSVAAAVGFAAVQLASLIRSVYAAVVAMRTLGAASLLASGPLGLLVAAGTLAGFLVLEKMLGENRENADALAASLAKVNTELQATLQKLNDAQRLKGIDFEKDIDALTQNVQTGLTSLQALYNQAADKAIEVQEQVNKNLDRQLQERLALTESVLQKVVDAEINAAEKIASINEQFAKTEQDFSKGKFDRDIDRRLGDDEAAKANALIQRAQQLLEAAERQEGSVRENLLDQAQQYAEQVARGNEQWEAGEAIVDRVFEARRDLANEAINKQVLLQHAAEQTREALEGSVAALRAMVEQQTKLGELTTQAQKDGDNKAVEDLNKRSVDLAAQIERSIADLDIPKALLADEEIKSMVDRIKEPIRSAFSGSPIGLKFAVEEGIAQVKATLHQAFADFKIPATLDFGAAGGQREIGFGGVKDLIQQVPELEAKMKSAKQAQFELEQQNAKTSSSFRSITESVNAAAAEMETITHAGGPFQAIDSFLETALVGSEGKVGQVEDAVTRIRTELQTLQGQTFEAIRDGDIEKLNQVQARLAQIREEFSKGGFNPLAEIIGQFETQVANIRTMQVEATTLRTQLEAGALAGAKLIDLNTAAQQVGALQQLNVAAGEVSATEAQLGQNASNAAVGVGNQSQAANAGVQQNMSLAQALRAAAIEYQRVEQAARAAAAAQAAAAAAGGGATGKALGGFMPYLSGGGFTPKGSDVHPAMLASGEFVMPANQSRRFAAELQSMRAGRSPQYLNGGGSVQENYNFGGDIIVNQQPGQDGVALAHSLKRVARRRTASIGG